MMPFATRTLCEWVPAGICELGKALGILRIAHVDDRGAVRARHVADIGDAFLDHDLAAAGAIELADLADAFC